MNPTLWAAGSLMAPLTRFAGGASLRFGPSGTLRAEIEGGGRPDLFLSAAPEHVQALVAAGLGFDPQPLCRNVLALLLAPGVPPTPDCLTDPGLRIATSLPGADPSGDYAMDLFDRLERLHPGHGARLRRTALRLAGGPQAPAAPPGRNHYGWVMEQGLCDAFVTYRSNAVQARRQVPALRILDLPETLSVSAAFAFCRLTDTPETMDWAARLRSPAFRALLREGGFPEA